MTKELEKRGKKTNEKALTLNPPAKVISISNFRGNFFGHASEATRRQAYLIFNCSLIRSADRLNVE